MKTAELRRYVVQYSSDGLIWSDIDTFGDKLVACEYMRLCRQNGVYKGLNLRVKEPKK